MRYDRNSELLRSELFSIEQLKQHAVMMAKQHKLDTQPGPDKLLPKLADNERVLMAAYDIVTDAAIPGERIVSAEVWLLDNFYLIEQQIDLARRHLPLGYSRQLPRLSEGLSAGFPRIYDLALALISHMDGRVDHDNVTHIVAAYQPVETLKMGELWAFPIMLQLALLENLRRVCLRIVSRREELDAAVSWADRMLATVEKEPNKLILLLAEFAHADVPLTAAFVEEFYSRLQAHGPAMVLVQTWVEQKLLEQGVTASQLTEVASRAAAASQISIANSIGSLRFIGAMDWRVFVESLSTVEHILKSDPAGMYASQDFATRDRYRHIIEEVARDSSHSEDEVAQKAISLAQVAETRLGHENRTAHVGYYLIEQGRHQLEVAVDKHIAWQQTVMRMSRHFPLPLYLAPILLLTLLPSWWVLSSLLDLSIHDFWFWLLILPLIISMSGLGISLVNLLATLILPPRALPRLDFSSGIPDTSRTLVVVPTQLSSEEQVDRLIEALEIRYLGNSDPNLFFGLLTDYYDATESTLDTDSVLLKRAQDGIQALNTTYQQDRPCIFYLFHRPRVWNPHEQVWMGYERKRGKLEELNARLRGEALTAFSDVVGDTSIFASIRYIITLDTDTQLPRDTAKKLIGNIAHPLNRPVYNPEKGRIDEGYAILQPRASISLVSADQTWFTKLFAGESTVDPYTREVSDVYQDIFGEGSFIGKGIYDVDAFRLAVDGRFPENLILSHDLLESGYARSALVSDIDLIEEHPASYVTDISRRHRWIRGDWQLAGWLLPSVPGPNQPSDVKSKRSQNQLTALLVWKIFDNLRRSLVSPSILALILLGWLSGVGSAWMWLLLVMSLVLMTPVLSILIEAFRKPESRDWLTHCILTAKSAIRPLLMSILTIILLPYDAMICLDAIFRSGVKMLFTRRGLLIWHLGSYTKRNARQTLLDYFLEMWIAPSLAFLLGLAMLNNVTQTAQPALFFPLLLMWLSAPAIGWWMSKPLSHQVPRINQDQSEFLRLSARRTWRFFSEFVSPVHNWLPPDNFQEYPIAAVAYRTSPTNMGMSLLANLAAHDFGYITTPELLRLTANTLSTMHKLERYRGHFYNWYDTRTLQPLHPRYVSSVDSGNLVGSLLTLQAGLAELKHQPVVSKRIFQGLQDTLRQLTEHEILKIPPTISVQIEQIDQMLQTSILNKAVSQNVESFKHVLRNLSALTELLIAHFPAEIDADKPSYYWVHAFHQQCYAFLNEIELLPSEMDNFSYIPTLLQVSELYSSNPNSSGILERLELIKRLQEECRALALMDFEFLYDTNQDLLSIGFDVGERRRDPSCYDLLASEARLASFLLIAEGKVPQKHWFSLGRLLTSHAGDVSLISWSGSMFEYLMPRLLMQDYDNTLLSQTSKTVVQRQIEYGRQRAVPWGISESGYNTTDASQIYQYRAFGIPGLGFKRGLGDDLVIAPYASALALMVLPEEACRNLQVLAKAGFLGDYGFYEAIDYTPSRVPRGKSHAIVRSFMAHHQGMSLLAYDHVLNHEPMQRRFMSIPAIKATELLLQERVPKRGATLHPHVAEVSAAAKPPGSDAKGVMRVFPNPNAAIPEVHLLSNGRYHVMASNAGGGYSRCGNIAITRWREDTTADASGTFVYLRDKDNGRYWSSTYQPTLTEPEHYEAIFVQGRAEYRRRDLAIESHTEIAVSPEDDIEIRRVTLTNLSSKTRQIEVTSYAEVVLAPLNSDVSHRAFSNLFVQTEILQERSAVLCSRRPRTPEEQVMWMFHLLATPDVAEGEVSYETDRAKFIGRGRSLANPIALDRGKSENTLSNTSGSVLDPVVAIRRTIALNPDASVSVNFITGVAESREAALILLSKYCDKHFIERAFEMAWFHSQGVLRHINATEADAQIFGRLAGSVVYGHAMRRAAPNVIARNRLGQSGLWRFSVSGDLPIVLLCIGDLDRIALVKQVLQAHAYWRAKGLAVDLVIINEDFSGYRAVLQDQIMGLIHAGVEVKVTNQPVGVFVRRVEDLSEDERVLLMTVARVVFTDTSETLVEQVERRVLAERKSERFEAQASTALESPTMIAKQALIFENGLGGFTPDGREYVITLAPGQTTPAPWVNVIASPHIGTVVSESGSAYSWVENAHEFRLTTWHNDPVSDPTAEAFYIRDEETGAFWSPTPLPAGGKSGYVCRHGFGYSVFEHVESGIESSLHTYVAMDAPVKFVVIKLHNQTSQLRRMSLTGYWELVLGEWRHANLMHIVTEVDIHSGALFARNAYGREFRKYVVFAKVSGQASSVSGSRTAFVGRNGTLKSPAAMHRKRLSGLTGAGFDPCVALQTHIELAAGQEQEVVFILGATGNTDDARQLIQQYSEPVGAREALDGVCKYWRHTLDAVQVETPDTALDLLVNGWLLYQTISSRLWGRSGYYQSGGAFGFRDQLQDTMALIHTKPALAREQIMRCAARQFPQGDVQHWWHPPQGQGVRTHFSDDYLWLAYATCRYVTTTGDTGILNEPIHFLEGRELKPEEEAYYDQPQRSNEVASLYEHCMRAIKHGLRFGSHQLPLMGCGDWNDGMNLVGRDGKGESVWLGWFLYENLQLFSGLARSRGDTAFADICTGHAWQLRTNIEANAWDGAWYRRAYFDDGTPLGSSENEECKIDSISQSWAIISGGGEAERSHLAMQSVDQYLVKHDMQLVKLLDPAFDKSALEPGYIKGYVPGVRENGGQYTHAAIWASMAYGMMGDKVHAWELFTMLNPINHSKTPEELERYKVEPYVMAADIYAAKPHVGRGGWTWYTGAAGWMYRLSLETLLGVHLEVDHLRITPCIPVHWTAYTIHYRYHQTLYHITIHQIVDKTTQVAEVSVDGVKVETQTDHGVEKPSNNRIPLKNDQIEHHVEVFLG